jgi:hypothetical protein
MFDKMFDTKSLFTAPARAALTSLTVLALSMVAVPIASAEEKMDGYVLQQNSELGPLVMSVSKTAMRMDIEKMGINWIARAPKWQSYAFNPETKCIISRDYGEWKENLIRMPGSSKKRMMMAEFTLKSTGQKEKVSGYLCRKMAIVRQLEPGSKKAVAAKAGPKAKRPVNPNPAGYVWISDEFPAPKQVTELMKQLTRVKVDKGVVLKASVLRPGSYQDYKSAFETLSITKQKLPSSLFEPPKGYTEVGSEIDLMMGAGGEEPPSFSSIKKRP